MSELWRRRWKQLLLDLGGQFHFFLDGNEFFFFLVQTRILDHLRRLRGNDRQQALVVIGKTFVLFFIVDRDNADQSGFYGHGHAGGITDRRVPWNPAETVVRSRIVDHERFFVKMHPAQHTFGQMEFRMIAGTYHTPHKGLHRLISCVIHESNNALFGVHRTQGTVYDRLHDLL